MRLLSQICFLIFVSLFNLKKKSYPQIIYKKIICILYKQDLALNIPQSSRWH